MARSKGARLKQMIKDGAELQDMAEDFEDIDDLVESKTEILGLVTDATALGSLAAEETDITAIVRNKTELDSLISVSDELYGLLSEKDTIDELVEGVGIVFPKTGAIKRVAVGKYAFSEDYDFIFEDADVNITNNTINKVRHSLRVGDTVVLSTTGTLPAGLNPATAYYVIPVDEDNISLATSRVNAMSGTAVDITAAAGTGTHTGKVNVLGSINLLGHKFSSEDLIPNTLPDNALVMRTFYKVKTTFTSATDAATIALQLNSANDIITATAISQVPAWNSAQGYILGVQDNTLAKFLELTAERELIMDVAVENLTAGELYVFVEYIEGEL